MARTTTNAAIHILTDEAPSMRLEANGERLVIDTSDTHGHFALSLTGGPVQRRAFAQALRQAADELDKWAALR
jgi:hypothetical protein